MLGYHHTGPTAGHGGTLLPVQAEFFMIIYQISVNGENLCEIGVCANILDS
jgi:hypothetical protein